MPRQRWQDPKIQTRVDVSRPFYFVRPFVPVVTPGGIVRKQKSIPLGFCDETSKRQAQAKKQEVMATVNAGKFVVECQIPFRDLARKYLDARLPQLGAATQAKYRHHIENHLTPDLGNLRLCDIDPATVEAWLAEKAKPKPNPDKPGEELPGLSWWTRADLKNILSAIFTAAAEWKLWRGDNPCTRVKLGRRRDVREKRILKPQDFLRLLMVLPEHVRFMVLIACLIGLRISEVLGLRWSDVELEKGTLTVAQRWHRGDLDEPKSSRSRRTRQLGALAEEFRRWRPADQAGAGYVFRDADGQPYDDRNLNQHILRPAARELGLYWKGFGFHTFRRMNISWRQDLGGAHPMEAMLAAGHTKLETTSEYFVIDADRERSQVNRILGALVNSVPPEPNQHEPSTGTIQ